MKLTVVFILFVSFSSLGQIPTMECVGDSLNVFHQESIVEGDTTSYILTGWTRNKQRHGVWHNYFLVGSDTTKHFRDYSIYEKGRLVKQCRIREKGTVETFYNSSSDVTEVVHSDSLGQVFFKIEYDYKGKYERYTTMYISNEQINAEGSERLMRIIAGCDSGMTVYKRVGKWKYYDSEGKAEVREEKVNDSVFEKVRGNR